MSTVAPDVRFGVVISRHWPTAEPGPLSDKRTPLDLITKSEKCPQADASSNPGVHRPVAKSAIAGFMRVDQGNRTGRSAEMMDFLKTVDRCGNAFHSRFQLEGQKLRVVA